MPKLTFDCPNCGAKKSAFQSSTYPDCIVHKCDGKILLEVGSFKNGQMTPVGKSLKVDNSIGSRNIFSRNFEIVYLQTVDEIMKAGTELKNGASSRFHAEDYLKRGKVYAVKPRGSQEILYLIFIEKGTIPGKHFFSGKNLQSIPKNDGEEILRSLVNEGVLNKNPFPLEYSV